MPISIYPRHDRLLRGVVFGAANVSNSARSTAVVMVGSYLCRALASFALPSSMFLSLCAFLEASVCARWRQTSQRRTTVAPRVNHVVHTGHWVRDDQLRDLVQARELVNSDSVHQSMAATRAPLVSVNFFPIVICGFLESSFIRLFTAAPTEFPAIPGC